MTWLDLPADHPYGIHNLPYGVFSTPGTEPRVGVRVGDHVLDVGACAQQAGMESGAVWLAPSLNAFLAEGRQAWSAARAWLVEQLTNEVHRECVEANLVPVDEVTMHLPVEVADYVDFYASEHHARNIGAIFRPDVDDPLTPNWKHLPIGYHGRAGTVVTSGTPVVRPHGQRRPRNADAPSFGPSQRLDIEAEVGFVVGTPSTVGTRVSTADFADHVFGVCLVNDWSARDIQAWEYQPLGPFLSKNFATTVSPWIVTLEALAPFRAAWDRPAEDGDPLPYLIGKDTRAEGALDIRLETLLETKKMAEGGERPHRLSLTSYRYAYWTVAQLVTHHTVNGCALVAGDILGTGTLSGPSPDQLGSLAELTQGGKQSLTLGNGEVRTFLEDGDRVTFRAWCEKPGAARISFGEVTARVLPAIS